MHHFRFEKGLKDEFVCCHIPCFCKGCTHKLGESLETRYTGPRSHCKLWPMMEIVDKDGEIQERAMMTGHVAGLSSIRTM